MKNPFFSATAAAAAFAAAAITDPERGRCVLRDLAGGREEADGRNPDSRRRRVILCDWRHAEAALLHVGVGRREIWMEMCGYVYVDICGWKDGRMEGFDARKKDGWMDGWMDIRIWISK